MQTERILDQLTAISQAQGEYSLDKTYEGGYSYFTDVLSDYEQILGDCFLEALKPVYQAFKKYAHSDYNRGILKAIEERLSSE